MGGCRTLGNPAFKRGDEAGARRHGNIFVALAFETIDLLLREAQQRNAVLVGGTGTGKTHLAIAIARSCIRSGVRGRFYNVVDLVKNGNDTGYGWQNHLESRSKRSIALRWNAAAQQSFTM